MKNYKRKNNKFRMSLRTHLFLQLQKLSVINDEYVSECIDTLYYVTDNFDYCSNASILDELTNVRNKLVELHSFIHANNILHLVNVVWGSNLKLTNRFFNTFITN